MRTKSTAVTFLTWVLVIAAGIYTYVARAEIVRDEILALSSVSAAVAAAMYFVMGCVRGFTLIPVTYLIPLGLQDRYPGILKHASGWISCDPEAYLMDILDPEAYLRMDILDPEAYLRMDILDPEA